MDLLSSLEDFRDSYNKGNKIESKNVFIAILIFLMKRRTRRAALRFIRTVQRDFFLPQFQGKFKIRKWPVVWVDHPLDSKVPFRPQHVAIYLSFSHFWIKSVYFLYREFGSRAIPAILHFVHDLDLLYRESAQVFRTVQSTTNRPHHYGGFYFKVIHLFDPHLACVPSLHVGVVGLTYLSMYKLIDEMAVHPEEYRAEKDYLWRRAVLITESILFIKQHSVNCVAAGLYSLSSRRYGYTEEESHLVIDALFTGEGNTLEDSEELREYIRNLYDHFMEQRRQLPEEKNTQVLIDFLLSYETYLETWKQERRLPSPTEAG